MTKPNAKTVGTTIGGGSVAGAIIWAIVELMSANGANARQDSEIARNREKCEELRKAIENDLESIQSDVKNNGNEIKKNGRLLERLLTMMGE